MVRTTGSTSQLDVPIPDETQTICFRSEGGTLALGEIRVVEPETGAIDGRPRWVLLNIFDALRADALTERDAEHYYPAMSRMRREGLTFLNAISAGCHTRASLWSLLSGRDLFRFGPGLAQDDYIPLDYESCYARATLAISHLAEAAGYHSVFLGSNSWLRTFPGYARLSSLGSRRTGTIDGVAKIAPLFQRYADERIFLTYWESAAHASAVTPQRLYDELHCAGLPEIEEARCAYRARVRHGDEAFAQLQQALEANGLLDGSLQVLTADHGEALGDGLALETKVNGVWRRMDRGHGYTCRPGESHIPLIVRGRGVEPGSREARVSSLDIFPTLAELLGAPVVHQLDGVPLPLTALPTRTPTRRFFSYGFCNKSVIEGDLQLLAWDPACRTHRSIGSGGEAPEVVGRRFELLRRTPSEVRPTTSTEVRERPRE